MKRRAFLASAAAIPLATTPFVSIADTGQSRTAPKQVAYHVREIGRILREAAPDGAKPSSDYFVVHGNLVCNAFPSNWEIGQPYAQFQSLKNGWHTTH